jgi:superfamily II DNA/RNA helicase
VPVKPDSTQTSRETPPRQERRG